MCKVQELREGFNQGSLTPIDNFDIKLCIGLLVIATPPPGSGGAAVYLLLESQSFSAI